MPTESEVIIALTRSAGCDDDTYTDYVVVPTPLYDMLAAFIKDGTITRGDDRFLAIAELLQPWVHTDVTSQDRTNIAFTIAQQHGRKVTFPNWSYVVDD